MEFELAFWRDVGAGVAWGRPIILVNNPHQRVIPLLIRYQILVHLRLYLFQYHILRKREPLLFQLLINSGNITFLPFIRRRHTKGPYFKYPQKLNVELLLLLFWSLNFWKNVFALLWSQFPFYLRNLFGDVPHKIRRIDQVNRLDLSRPDQVIQQIQVLLFVNKITGHIRQFLLNNLHNCRGQETIPKQQKFLHIKIAFLIQIDLFKILRNNERNVRFRRNVFQLFYKFFTSQRRVWWDKICAFLRLLDSLVC